MQENISNLILKLYSLSLPDTVITTIIKSMSNLIFPLLTEIIELSGHSEKIISIIEIFQSLLCTGVTTYKRKKNIDTVIVKPISKSYGIRNDSMYDLNSQHYLETFVTCTFTYVPILDTLKFILSNDFVRSYVFSDTTRNPTTLTHFGDGELFKNNIFFQENKYALQLTLYFDEFEICNPLGSKKTCHKTGAFYFTLNNLPMHMNSRLNNIHLVALCYNIDIKKFKINPVLNVIVDDLKILESKGIFIDAMNINVKGTLVNLSHDSLAAAMMYGMMESFNANYNYCRICVMPKSDAQITCFQNNKLLRTKNTIIKELNDSDKEKSQPLYSAGIVLNSKLNELKYFNLWENYSVDVMHDLLEGVCDYELKYFFEFLSNSSLISIDNINLRIHTFDYGLANRSNKPSSIIITNCGISQSASQTLCLMIYLPLILEDIVIKPEVVEKWNVFLMLLEILKIVISPTIPRHVVDYLRTLISHHHAAFMREYGIKLKPKFHLLLHYPDVIIKGGPPRAYWTMRFESKHQYFKDVVRKLKNFNNVTMMLSERHQFHMLHLWNNILDQYNEPILQSFKYFFLESSKYCNFISAYFQVSKRSTIYNGKNVLYIGAKLSLNKFIHVNFANDLPTFIKVLQFFSFGDSIYAIGEKWYTEKICNKTAGYCVIKRESDLDIIKISDCLFTKSFEEYVTSDGKSVIITEYFLAP